jgi:hypothetical protein
MASVTSEEGTAIAYKVAAHAGCLGGFFMYKIQMAFEISLQIHQNKIT